MSQNICSSLPTGQCVKAKDTLFDGAGSRRLRLENEAFKVGDDAWYCSYGWRLSIDSSIARCVTPTVRYCSVGDGEDDNIPGDDENILGVEQSPIIRRLRLLLFFATAHPLDAHCPSILIRLILLLIQLFLLFSHSTLRKNITIEHILLRTTAASTTVVVAATTTPSNIDDVTKGKGGCR